MITRVTTSLVVRVVWLGQVEHVADGELGVTAQASGERGSMHRALSIISGM